MLALQLWCQGEWEVNWKIPSVQTTKSPASLACASRALQTYHPFSWKHLRRRKKDNVTNFLSSFLYNCIGSFHDQICERSLNLLLWSCSCCTKRDKNPTKSELYSVTWSKKRIKGWYLSLSAISAIQWKLQLHSLLPKQVFVWSRNFVLGLFLVSKLDFPFLSRFQYTWL